MSSEIPSETSETPQSSPDRRAPWQRPLSKREAFLWFGLTAAALASELWAFSRLTQKPEPFNRSNPTPPLNPPAILTPTTPAAAPTTTGSIFPPPIFAPAPRATDEILINSDK